MMTCTEAYTHAGYSFLFQFASICLHSQIVKCLKSHPNFQSPFLMLRFRRYTHFLRHLPNHLLSCHPPPTSPTFSPNFFPLLLLLYISPRRSSHIYPKMSTFAKLETTIELPTPPPETSPAPSASAPGALGNLSTVAAFMPSIESLKNRMGDVWSRSRPWAEFTNTSQMSKPEFAELFDRIKENAEYYAFNYLVILLFMSALTILTSPLSFLGGLFIALTYFYLYFLNPEPLVIAGLTVDNNFKAAFITLFSLVILWLTGAGATFTVLVAVVGVIALTHAAVRRPPGEADFETAYTPATV